MTQLTRAEAERAVAAVRRWPPRARRELLELPPNERDVLALLGGELGAMPVLDQEPEIIPVEQLSLGSDTGTGEWVARKLRESA